MNHYTDKDMTSEEFCNLLKDRLQRGKSMNSEDTYYGVLEWIAILLIVMGITLLLVS